MIAVKLSYNRVTGKRSSLERKFVFTPANWDGIGDVHKIIKNCSPTDQALPP